MRRPFITLIAVLCGAVTSLTAGDVPLGHADFKPTPERPVGWRGDGTGRYPGATPVTDWDITTGKNIIWKTRFTGFSFAGPTVVGDRVFTTAEPDLLVCVDAKTGKELWRRHNAIQLEKFDEKERERLYGVCDQVLEYANTWHRLPAELADGTPCHDMGNVMRIWVPVTDHRQKALIEQVPLLAAKRGIDLEKVRALFREVGSVDMKKRNPDALLSSREYSWTGNMPGTPASDGHKVVVKAQSENGWGHLVCYDLDGKRLWHVEVGMMGDWGCPYQSPIILGGRVFTQARWSKDPVNGNAPFEDKAERFAAFDISTGKPLWSVPSRQRTSSPVVVVADGIPVVMIANKFYLPETGAEVLDLNPYIASDVDTPCVEGDRILFKGGEGKTIANEGKGGGRFSNPAAIVRVFWKEKGKTLAYEEVWRAFCKGMGATRGSLLLADGWIYHHAGAYSPNMFAFDPKDRSTPQTAGGTNFRPDKSAIARKDIERGVPAENDMSCVLGGKFVFGCPTNWPSQFIVISHGTGTKILSTPAMDGAVMGSPAFQGDRMYIRDYNHLYCIGPK